MTDRKPFALLQEALEWEIDVLQQYLEECLREDGEQMKLEACLLRLMLKKRKSRLESVRTLLCSDET